ncbi:MAG: TonB-dependent receptor [Chitinophagales bacterium]|nr:MAG: TonB-dependent receptor [Chitinophagales bacterium]
MNRLRIFLQAIKKYVIGIMGILLLGLFSPARGQSLSVYGLVTDRQSGVALEGAYVVVDSLNHHTTTDPSGKFKIEGLLPGEYTLLVSHLGMQPVLKKIHLHGKSVQVNIEMDSLIKTLSEITINSRPTNQISAGFLNNIEGTSIYAGKKTEVIRVGETCANLASNNSRQIYGRIAGLNIWESDAGGLQLGIGGRGLSPHRTSNFNTRQNGYDISADALGYPESYYTPPAEAIERIELIRGAASLQYGTQFGGMLNFTLKTPPTDKVFSFETRNTAGSYGFFSSFTSLGGTKKNFSYYGFYQYKRGNGWRENSAFTSHTAYLSLSYRIHPKLKVQADYTLARYLQRQPGGLTDAQFQENPRQSTRERNWFQIKWNIPVLMAQYDISPNTKADLRTFALIGERNALGFLGTPNRADPMEERDLISTQFRNWGSELRLLHRYTLSGNYSALLTGVRLYQGKTHNKQGMADDGYDADFHFLSGNENILNAHDFPSFNAALFAENIFAVSKKFTITPGMRIEYISTLSKGFFVEVNSDLAGNEISRQTFNDSQKNQRVFILGGIGMSYKHRPEAEFYANLSQNYRAINFNDLRIVNPNFRVDASLKDEKGFSADLGARGTLKNWLYYDLSTFVIRYQDKIGYILKVDSSLFTVYRLRTNVADAYNYGLECATDLDILRAINENSPHSLSLFASFTIQNGVYKDSREPAFDGKKVEMVPGTILRTGTTYRYKTLKMSLQYSYTSRHYTDATNAEFTANAVNGVIPAYYVMDFSVEYAFRKWVALAAGINNLTNNRYFTRRADGYPGPGIIPADGITAYGTLIIKR